MLFLQEIILLNEESHFIFKIGDEFDATVLPSKCQCFQGRPSGGIAILWRKSLEVSLKLFHMIILLLR